MTDQEILDILRQEQPYLRKNFGVLSIGLFGSYAKGIQGPDSDVDLLIDFPDDNSVLDYVALQRELEMLLSRKVDLVMTECLHPRIKEQVLREAHPL